MIFSLIFIWHFLYTVSILVLIDQFFRSGGFKLRLLLNFFQENFITHGAYIVEIDKGYFFVNIHKIFLDSNLC